MARKFIYLYVGLFLSAAAATAQTDSLAGRDLREVQVFGRPATRYAAGSRVSTLDSTLLHVYNSTSLAEVLQYRSLLALKNYGAGMLATAAFRGTSASQTAVLWHGFNINLPTLGQTDFSTIPVNAFSTVDIQHGSAGATYGSATIGGAVLLSTAPTFAPGLKLRLQQDAGSFGRRYSSLGGSYGTGKWHLQASAYQHASRNNFPFINFTKAGSPREEQENAAIAQRGFTQEASLKTGKRTTAYVRSWYNLSDNQSQPNMVAANTHARIRHENLRLMGEWERHSAWGKTRLRAAFFNDGLHYRDDNVDSRSRIETYQAQAEHAVQAGEKLSVKTGGEVQHFSALVSGYGRHVRENRGSLFALLRYHPTSFLHLSGNLRQSFVTGYNPPIAPTAGLQLFFLSNTQFNLSFKGNVARGYRVPTLNDRFWPTGNPALKPESSWTYENGLAYQYRAASFRANTELTLYHLVVDNWIQWTPSPSTGLWSPRNLKLVHSRGLEYSAEGHYRLQTLRLTAGAQYAYTRSRQVKNYFSSGEPLAKQLIYVPLHTGNAYLNLRWHQWFLSPGLQYTGYRFTTAENDRWLPAFTLFNLAAGKTFRRPKYQVELVTSVNNLTNISYQTMEYYAMPGRHYNVSLRFSFGKPVTTLSNP